MQNSTSTLCIKIAVRLEWLTQMSSEIYASFSDGRQLRFWKLLEIMRAFAESVACHKMIVHYTGSLHKRIDNCWPHASEPSLHKVLAYEIRFWCLCRYLPSMPEPTSYRFVVHETPAVVAEGPELLLDLPQ